jgi:membrane protein YdbS with pleckstrin-like domain
MILRFSLLYLGFHKKKYALRERDILYKTGLLWRSNTVIPFNRIQHAEVNQGPLDRLFNLAILRVFTAGGGSSDMVIPGLRPAEAQNIKEFILKRTAFDEEE